MRKWIISLVLFTAIVLLTACKAGQLETIITPKTVTSDEITEQSAMTVKLPAGKLPEKRFSTPSQPDRYFPDTTLELIPSSDYETILPYIGGFTYSVMGTSSELIGVCDEKGKIVCDPVYNDVKLIEKDGVKLYAFIKNKLEQSGGNYKNEYTTTIAAVDGSWVSSYESALWEETSAHEMTPPFNGDYSSISYLWREPVKYEYITVRRDGKWGVLDWDGRVLLPFEYMAPVCFHEGLASVVSEDGEFLSFIDITGKTVIEPFEAPPTPMHDGYISAEIELYATNKVMFYEGYARFYDNGKFGMLDHDGNIVVPAEYDFITSFYTGTALFIVNAEDGYENQELGVIDNTGRVIYVQERGIWPQKRNGQPGFWDSNTETWVKINADGTQETHEISRSLFEDDKFVFKDSGIEFSADKYNLESINDDLLIISDRNQSVWRLYDDSGNPLTPERPGIYGYQPYWNYPGYIWIHAAKYGEWTWPPSYELYDYNGNLVIDGVYKTIIPFDGKFLVRGVRTAGLKDKDGQYIIEMSVMSYGID